MRHPLAVAPRVDNDLIFVDLKAMLGASRIRPTRFGAHGRVGNHDLGTPA
jgi:hypothetical protein